MKRGYLQRDRDVSGVSGTGKVAEAVKATDGRIVIFWPPPWDSVASFETEEKALGAHGHNGASYFVWLDEFDVPHCELCHTMQDFCSVHPVCPGCLVGAEGNG